MSAWQRDGWDAWGNHGWWDSRPNSWSSNDSSDGYRRPSYESQTTSWTSKPCHDDNQTWSHWAGSDASDQDTLCTSPLAGKKDKDKYKNISTLGCIGQHPLPLDECKRLFFTLCQLVDPTAGESETHSKLSRVALASWDAACIQAAFWLICCTSPKVPFRTLTQGVPPCLRVPHGTPRNAKIPTWGTQGIPRHPYKIITPHLTGQCSRAVSSSIVLGWVGLCSVR